MDVSSVELGFRLGLSLHILGWMFLGIALGSISGLIPGIHANNFALVLAGLASAVPGPPLYVGVAMLSAGVIHTFLNAVPAMALGVPDAEMAVTALPGHRMMIEGNGYEAIRLSALGSILAVLIAVPLAIPVTLTVLAYYSFVIDNLTYILLAIVTALIITEHSLIGKLGGLLSFLTAACLGWYTLDLEPESPLDGGGMLAPLFAGLFGAPVLIDAVQGGGVPPQHSGSVAMSKTMLFITAIAGALAGAIVGYLPGISAAIAAVAVLVFLPGGSSDRSYIVATSGVDTANMIFGLFALVAIGQPRSGVMVAFENVDAPLELPILLAAVVLSGLIGFVLVITIGDTYLALVSTIEYWQISVVVLGILFVISFLFTGFIGVIVFVVAGIIGLIPVRLQARRVHLMGVLLGPLILY